MTIGTRHWRWVAFALSAWITIGAARFFVMPLPEASGAVFGEHLARHGLWFYAHAGGGGVALLAGALQWLSTTRTRRARWHRLIGRTYAIAIAVAGTSGFSIALEAFGGPVPRAGFSALAVAWLATTAVAWRRARTGDWPAHRAWMMRSFALTFAAVTLRVWLPLFIAAGVSFEAAYRLVAWWSWIPNLLLAEWLIAREQAPLRHRVLHVGRADSSGSRPAGSPGAG